MVKTGPLASQSGDDDENDMIIRTPICVTSGKSTQRWLYSGCLGSLPPHLQPLDIGSILNMISQNLGVHFGRNYPPKKSAVCLHYPAFFSPDLV